MTTHQAQNAPKGTGTSTTCGSASTVECGFALLTRLFSLSLRVCVCVLRINVQLQECAGVVAIVIFCTGQNDSTSFLCVRVCVCANGFGKSKARLVNGAAIEWQDSSNQSVAQARDSRGDRTTGPIDSE